MNLTKTLKDMPKGQRRAGKALIGFFALMLALTFISRGLDAFTVARVTANAPSFGRLTREIALDGAAEARSESAAVLPAGFVLRELYIREGVRVAAGDPVALLDLNDIERQLSDARRELEDARLAAAAKQLQPPVARRENYDDLKLLQERAKEDAAALVDDAEFALSRARTESAEARRERRRLIDEGYEESQLKSVEDDIAAREWAEEEAERALEEARFKGERLVEDARARILSALETEELERGKNASDAETRRLESGRDSLLIAEKQALIGRLEALKDSGGKVVAEGEGLVTALSVKPGDLTTNGGAFLLSGRDGSVFAASATKKEAELLSPGDAVEVALIGRREPAQGKITAIAPPQTPGGSYSVTAELNGTEAAPGTAGTLKAVIRAGAETGLLPLSALYSEGFESRGYVFVLRERSTTMGPQTVVERLDVEILGRGGQNAAVAGGFSPDDKIVTASSRLLTDGDRVRLTQKTQEAQSA